MKICTRSHLKNMHKRGEKHLHEKVEGEHQISQRSHEFSETNRLGEKASNGAAAFEQAEQGL